MSSKNLNLIKLSKTLLETNCDPFPYESLNSKLLRVVWRNVLTPGTLFDLMSAFKNRTLSSPGEIFSHDEYEFKIVVLGGYKSIWFDSFFCFCPICLEHGYHTYWFQLLEMAECPIHGCRLLNFCQSCGTNLKYFGHNKETFATPYYCLNCMNPISGVAPNIVSVREFREHSLQISNSFKQVALWFSHIDVEWVNRNCFCDDVKNQWCKTVSTLKASMWLSSIKYKSPLGFNNNHSAFVCYSWSIRMVDRLSSNFLNGNDCGKSTSVGIYNKVYRCVLRRLEKWIFNNRDFSKMREAESAYKNKSYPLNLADWDPKILAYLIFVHSNGAFWWPDETATYTRTFYNNEFGKPYMVPMFLASFDGRRPRVAFKCLLFAYFAGLYQIIINAIKNGVTAWKGVGGMRFDEIVALESSCDIEGMHVGKVVFMNVEGLPFIWR